MQTLVLAVVVAAVLAPTIEVLWERDLSAEGDRYAVGEPVDLNGDGSPEVLVQLGYRDEPSRIVALDGTTGEILWSARFGGRSDAVPADLDGDGAAAVVVAFGDSLLALNGRTGNRTGARRLRGDFGEITSGRLDDAKDSVLCTSGEKRSGVLAVFSGGDLSERWSVEAAAGSGPFARGFARPVVRDTNGDSVGEVLVAENGNLLRCLNWDGVPLWQAMLGPCERLNPEGVVSADPLVADLVPGGTLEVAVGCFAGALVVLNAESGEEIARAHFGHESHRPHLGSRFLPGFIRRALEATGEPVNCLTAVELDGEPGQELVLGCSDGFLYAWGYARVGPDGRAGSIWSFDTRGDVYDPCVPVRALPVSAVEMQPEPARSMSPSVRAPAVTVPAPPPPSAANEAPSLIAWDADATYLVEGATGASESLLPHLDGSSSLIVGDLDGDGLLEIVRLGPRGARAVAWSARLEPWSEELSR